MSTFREQFKPDGARRSFDCKTVSYHYMSPEIEAFIFGSENLDEDGLSIEGYDPYSEEACLKFAAFLKDNELHYYGRIKEQFSLLVAIDEAAEAGKLHVLLDNYS